MASIIRNARVEGGRWTKSANGWTKSDDGRVEAYGIVDDDNPNSAPEVYRSRDGAEKMLAWLKQNSTSRGIIFQDS